MRRKGITVMYKLVGLIKPLAGFMALAIFLGILGNLAAIALPVLGSMGLLKIAGYAIPGTLSLLIGVLIACAVSRGFLRYGEQACNHFIAFKVLALIRHKVFIKLRELSPAKLESKRKGDLISVLTSDVELLEVFYAHTISPIVIAIAMSVLMAVFFGSIHPLLAVVALLGYGIIGAGLPLLTAGKGGDLGQTYRNGFGEANSFFLDSIRGLNEVLQFGAGDRRQEEMNRQNQGLEKLNRQLKDKEGRSRALTDTAVYVISLAMLGAALYLHFAGRIGFDGLVLSVVGMMSSFGPVLALSSLSNNLYHTIASGNRVLDLLEESPRVQEVTGQPPAGFGTVEVENVTFSYDEELILDNLSFEVPAGRILGIHGRSGAGKSTVLKLLMRFWEADQGHLRINSRDVREINTSDLRIMESYMTQDTFLFHDSIAANIKLGRPNATREEMIAAAQKASIHDFISALPEGYDTNVGELGDRLSGGEKQRIGLARTFLYDAPLLLLDEPTSNLDSLNEGIILRSIRESREGKTVLLVSHRKSTMNLADETILVENGRIS